MSTEALVSHLASVYSDLSIDATAKVDVPLIESYIISLKSTSLNPEIIEVISFLFYVINNPNYHTISDESDCLIELLSSLLLSLSLTEVIEIFDNLNNFDFNSILQICLDQTASHAKIQQLAIDLLTKSTALEIRKISHHVIVRVFKIFSSFETPLNVVNSIDKFFNHVLYLSISDHTIFNDTFTIHNIETLLSMRSTTHSPVLTVRLIDLLIKMFEKFPQIMISNKTMFANLYIFEEKSFLENDDFFYLNKLINLHSSIFSNNYDHLLDSSASNNKISNEYVAEKFKNQLRYIFQLYSLSNDDTMIYSVNELIEFYSVFSRFDEAKFLAFSEKYQIITQYSINSLSNASNVLLLASINPKVLLSFDLSGLSLTNKSLPIFINYISYEDTFEVIRSSSQLSLSAISNLTLENTFEIMYEMARFSYSAKYLLKELPVLVHNHLVSANINDRENIMVKRNFRLNQLKIEILAELVKNDATKDETLLSLLKTEKNKLASGDIYSDTVQAAVGSKTS
ncbi:hypothetical protein DASC09_030710 [Saccharomycopsis crataegensis]|uniref:DNA mismatch repair protein HSM3 n=1 Tax=Saccharomycopsis crataegensis TaxID=43959 RepID=A0AAV5QME7_9ASCO|nr:hypothetical protein DASC09_030710 [Saccharomycopsis crataegensis]